MSVFCTSLASVLWAPEFEGAHTMVDCAELNLTIGGEVACSSLGGWLAEELRAERRSLEQRHNLIVAECA